MAQQAPTRPKPAGAPRRRHRTGHHHASDHRELEQCPAPRRCAGSASQQRRPAARTTGPLSNPPCAWAASASPDSQTSRSAAPRPDQRPAHRGTARSSTRHTHTRAASPGRKVPALQMRQKPVHHRDVRPLPTTSPAIRKTSPSPATRSPIGTSKPKSHRPPVSAPTSLAGGTSPAPSVSP